VADGPATPSQAQIDRHAGWGIIDGVVDIYNQNLAGRPSGSQNITATCPSGGSVRITGSTSVDTRTSITSVNLSYAMTDCQVIETLGGGTVVSLKFNGTVTEVGSWNIPSYKNSGYHATSLIMSGTDTSTGFTDASLTQTCDVNLTHSISGQSNTEAGTICGRTVN
jgi:hypothetical protein